MNVEFRTPILQRVFDVLFVLAVCALTTIFGSILAFLLLSSAMPRTWSVRSMMGASAVVALLGALAILALWRARPSRIGLDERTLRARGLLYRRTLAYEDIALLTLERPENTLGKACRVIMRRRRGRPISIWLSRADAEECFDILRRLCEHAPAIDLEQGVLAPENPLHRRHGLLVAADEFRRKARRNVVVGALFLLFSASSITSLVRHYQAASPSTRSITRRWFSAVFCPIAAAGSALSWRRNRRFASELEDGADHPWAIVDADDADELEEA